MYRSGAMARGPPYIYLLMCFLSRPTLSHTFHCHSFGLSAKCSCLPLSQGTKSPVTVHPASLLLRLPCHPTSLGEKLGHPGSPNKLDLATVPNIYFYFFLKKIVIA